MPGELSPDDVLNQLGKGRLFPFYLFYGESEFLLERVLKEVRETFIPEEGRDFNLQIFYGDEAKANPGEIIDTASSFPFLSQNRLIILRRTEEIPTAALESFIPYLDEPMETSCLIFVSSKPDFRKKFYKKIKNLDRAVNFRKLYDNQVVPWIMKMARELGLNIDSRACAYLQQIVGNRMRDLYSELEKIYLCYGKANVGMEEAKKVAIYSRSHTIFELMDNVSLKKCEAAMAVLKRYMEEEGKDATLGIMGMFIRQIRLLWQTKSVMERGGRTAELSKELRVQNFVAKRLEQQSKQWRTNELEKAFDLLYQADGLLKTGSQGHLVLENLVLSLCK
ncbi:MAG: DNA polymerase III subunit delta [Deltaproteobacteria bacterium]|nr:DNA polymerase III subunit delta [Deltaproteobacteria bacterium]